MSESDRKYPKLSKNAKSRFLSDWKNEFEQGLVSPGAKPSFLGLDPDRFASLQNFSDGIPRPEFSSISRNMLDCFATAVLSARSLRFPRNPLFFRCQLRENSSSLTLHLAVMLLDAEEDKALVLNEKSEIWIGSRLRPLAKAKGISIGNIFWDRPGLHSVFWFDYPGKMVLSKVPGSKPVDDGGTELWPECGLVLDSIDSTMIEKAKMAIHFVLDDADGSVQ